MTIQTQAQMLIDQGYTGWDIPKIRRLLLQDQSLAADFIDALLAEFKRLWNLS